jgi:hypothetical protein
MGLEKSGEGNSDQKCSGNAPENILEIPDQGKGGCRGGQRRPFLGDRPGEILGLPRILRISENIREYPRISSTLIEDFSLVYPRQGYSRAKEK